MHLDNVFGPSRVGLQRLLAAGDFCGPRGVKIRQAYVGIVVYVNSTTSLEYTFLEC